MQLLWAEHSSGVFWKQLVMLISYLSHLIRYSGLSQPGMALCIQMLNPLLHQGFQTMGELPMGALSESMGILSMALLRMQESGRKDSQTFFNCNISMSNLARLTRKMVLVQLEQMENVTSIKSSFLRLYSSIDSYFNCLSYYFHQNNHNYHQYQADELLSCHRRAFQHLMKFKV